MGLLHLITTPPPPRVEDLPFLLSPEEWLKLHSPLKTYLKWAYPWRIWVWTPKNSIYIFFILPLNESSIFITYPWRIPWFFNRGGADIKCNSPRQLILLISIRFVSCKVGLAVILTVIFGCELKSDCNHVVLLKCLPVVGLSNSATMSNLWLTFNKHLHLGTYWITFVMVNFFSQTTKYSGMSCLMRPVFIKFKG